MFKRVYPYRIRLFFQFKGVPVTVNHVKYKNRRSRDVSKELSKVELKNFSMR